MKLIFKLSILVILTGLLKCENLDLNLAPPKCPYRDTVDLSDVTPFENGSYLYENVLIPSAEVYEYNYRLAFRNIEEEAETHLRGCVCGKPKKCIKLCCKHGDYFNELTGECESIPEDMNIPIYLNVTSAEDEVNLVNLYREFVPLVGKPCWNLESLTLDTDMWTLNEDGTLYVHNDDALLDTVSYCLSPYRYNGSNEYVLVALSCPIKNEESFAVTFNTYAMAISVIFLAPTVLIYIFVPELRGNLRGKLLICYLISLIGGYSIISLINISEYVFEDIPCNILGFTCYFSFMSAFLWLSVLCFDIWLNFKDHSVDFSRQRHKLRFLFYSLYVWGTATLLMGLTMWAQWSDLVPKIYKPGIGDDICWLDTNKWSTALYFYGPNLLIILFNVGTFTILSLRIYRIRSDVAKLTQKQMFFKEKYLLSINFSGVVILRLFIVMGISWIMDIISFCLRDYKMADYLFFITDFCNAIQGVLIFILFVLKRNVIAAIRKSVRQKYHRKPRPSVTSISTHFSKLSSSHSTNA
ncbi:G-protein coupled receptor Mth2 isoform X1 [Musca domestica]|uniref:G-protein coupled receptor Mth2 isoform X1 n=1 Tax=Musca domestica TaxID=7370 RepID=A0A9J7D3H5_MUSDO|nr:G-protein coupled receptor Mth2 isoform X1 [Musca domestica]